MLVVVAQVRERFSPIDSFEGLYRFNPSAVSGVDAWQHPEAVGAEVRCLLEHRELRALLFRATVKPGDVVHEVFGSHAKVMEDLADQEPQVTGVRPRQHVFEVEGQRRVGAVEVGALAVITGAFFTCLVIAWNVWSSSS